MRVDGQPTKARSAKTLKTSVLFLSCPSHHAFTPVKCQLPSFIIITWEVIPAKYWVFD